MSLPTPYYEHGGITIYHGDCRDILPLLKADVVVTDPPYGVGLNYGAYDDRALGSLDWLVLCRRMASTIVTPGYRNLYAYPQADNLAIRFDRTAQSPASIAWMNKWEPILFYGKFHGRLPWDVIETACQSERAGEPLDHPCPKPLVLLRQLIGCFTEADDLILDPFMGSGTTLVAAKRLGRRAIGIEIEERYCEIAVKRLAQEVLPLEPPEPQPEQAELPDTIGE